MIDGKIGLISIIMGAYNAEKTIEETIQSVLNQTYTDFELIIVSDCSSDCTDEIIGRYFEMDSRIKYIRNETNRGICFSRKEATKHAVGEWLAVIDSDDIWKKEKLELQVKRQLETGGELLFTGSYFLDYEGKKLTWTMEIPEKIEYKQLLKQNLISNSSVLVKKYLYEKYYVMDESLFEDFAVWLQILKSGRVAFGINEPLLGYRINRKSRSSNKVKSAKMTWKTYRYMKLKIYQSIYYEVCYIYNGLKKYSHLIK